MKVVIIGGVAGGAGAAARLRRNDENAQIIMLERNGFISFANCGLPYYLGDVITERKELVLMTPEHFHARFNVDVRVMHEVLSELKEIAQRDGISCTCGSHRWKLQVNYSSVDLFCADCGAAMRIPAATADDIDDICCKTRLLIRGGEGR